MVSLWCYPFGVVPLVLPIVALMLSLNALTSHRMSVVKLGIPNDPAAHVNVVFLVFSVCLDLW